MAGRKRDPEGYALGRTLGEVVSRRMLERMERQEKSRADMSRATQIPTPHVTNLLNGTGTRLWQRHQVQAFCRALGVSEMELMGDLLFPEIGTVVTEHMPPGLAEFAKQHADEVTLAELQRLRDEIRVIEHDGERTYDEKFWTDMLRLIRKHGRRRTTRRGG